jgi:hypothetical protein
MARKPGAAAGANPQPASPAIDPEARAMVGAVGRDVAQLMAELDTLKHKMAETPRAGTPEALVATITDSIRYQTFRLSSISLKLSDDGAVSKLEVSAYPPPVSR